MASNTMELESTKKQLFTKIYNLCRQSSSYFISTQNFVVSEDKVYQREQNTWVEYEFNLEYVFKKIPYINNIYKNLDEYRKENERLRIENQELKNENEEFQDKIEILEKEIEDLKVNQENDENEGLRERIENISQGVANIRLKKKEVLQQDVANFKLKKKEVSQREIVLKIQGDYFNLVQQQPIDSNFESKDINEDIFSEDDFKLLYRSLNGKTSSSLYENYMNFYKYVLFFVKKNKNIYNYVPGPHDVSVVNKHILAAIRINDFLSHLPDGSYLKLETPITYWKTIQHGFWNEVRVILGLDKYNSKDWRDQIKLDK